MTKIKFLKPFLFVLCAVICMISSAPCAYAEDEVRYTNSETGYKVLIIDSDNLLSDEEESRLTEDMMPVTAYGNIAFWTTEENTYNEIEQARLKRKELFGFDSACIFVINMDIRKLTIQSYGDINKSITDSIARSITNNVSKYATSEDYYNCSKTAFSQILDVCEKRHISEPLKVSGYIVISLMSGLIIAISIAFSKRQNPFLASCMYENDNPYQIQGNFTGAVTASYVNQTTIHRPPSTSSYSSGGCSSCSSGSSCSSCSSCGGGGCGSGGSSDF